MFGTHQRLYAQGEGHGGAARNREKRADGQIQRAGKAQAVGAAHLLAQGKQAVAAGDADGGNSQQRKPDARNQQSRDCGPHGAAGLTAQIGGENQIARAKKHAEKHNGNQERFLMCEPVFHMPTPSCASPKRHSLYFYQYTINVND